MTSSAIPPDAQAKIDAWSERFRWPIIIAALAPFTGALVPFDFETRTALLVDLGSWLIFAFDLGVRVYYSRKYLRTGRGIMDTVIVVATFPWYIFPFWSGTAFLSVFRIVRLITVFLTGRTARRLRYLYDTLGVLGAVALIVIAVSSLIVLQTEPPEAASRRWVMRSGGASFP